jgi:uncharacterized protein YjbI with pentapeptide repeats
MKRKPTNQQILWAIVLGLALATTLALRFYLGIGRGDLLGYAPIAMVVILILIGLGRIGYRYEWTGFGESFYRKPDDKEILPRKTLWDWLNLLIVPAVLAFGGLWFVELQDARQREIEYKNRQQEALQAYFNAMSELVIEPEVASRETSASKEEVASEEGLCLDRSFQETNLDAKLQRARTMAVVQTLDGQRKRAVIRFLYETGQITLPTENPTAGDAIVYLCAADLSNADLHYSPLNNIDLEGATLHDANLQGAKLQNADLRRAKLIDADLRKAHLHNAAFHRANLKDANLKDAKGITAEELREQTPYTGGTIMPDGSKHE